MGEERQDTGAETKKGKSKNLEEVRRGEETKKGKTRGRRNVEKQRQKG